MNALHEGSKSKWRALMTVAAALSVLGLAGVLWQHPSSGAAASSALIATDEPATMNDFLRAPATTGVPSAASVFRGADNVAPEEPIAQF
jgi:hypothetical protein